MKVRMVDMPAGTNKGKAWEVGKEVDVDDERAQELVNTGKAVPVDSDAVVDIPSKLVAEAQARHEFAQTEYATPQERRQAAAELAAADDLHPQGSYAQLHEANMPARAVVDDVHARRVEVDEAEIEAVQGPALAARTGQPPAKAAPPRAANTK